MSKDDRKFKAFIRWLRRQMEKESQQALRDLALYGSATLRFSRVVSPAKPEGTRLQ